MSNPYDVVDNQVLAQLEGFGPLVAIVHADRIHLTDRGIDIRRFSQAAGLQPEIWIAPAQNQPDLQLTGSSSSVVMRHEIHIVVPGLDHTPLREIQFLIVRALTYWKNTEDAAGNPLAQPLPYSYGNMRLSDFQIQPPPESEEAHAHPILRAIGTLTTSLIGDDEAIRDDATVTPTLVKASFAMDLADWTAGLLKMYWAQPMAPFSKNWDTGDGDVTLVWHNPDAAAGEELVWYAESPDDRAPDQPEGWQNHDGLDHIVAMKLFQLGGGLPAPSFPSGVIEFRHFNMATQQLKSLDGGLAPLPYRSSDVAIDPAPEANAIIGFRVTPIRNA